MGKIGKTVALILMIIILMSSLTMLMVKLTNAQAGVTNPSLPSFEVTIESPLSGETITSNNVSLHFRINKTVDYGWVKTVYYYIYLDDSLYNQLNQSINTTNELILDKTIVLRLENTNKVKHTIEVDADIEYCPSSWIPLYHSTNYSSKVDFIVTDNQVGQTNAFQAIFTYVGIVVVIFAIVIVSVLLFRRHRKTTK